MNNNQPSFWLQVRKEYVVENFESLLTYLHEYQYDAAVETGDSDFNKSFVCLQQVVTDLLNDLKDTCIYHSATDKWGDRTVLNIRMIAAYLLACSKKGKTDYEVLCKLGHLLFVYNPKNEDLIDNFYSLTISCIQRKRVVSYGFTWNDITSNDSFVISMFTIKYFKTLFSDFPKNDTNYYIENHGLMLIHDGHLSIAPMNYYDFRRVKTQPQLNLSDHCDLLVSSREYTKKIALQDLYALYNSLSNEALNTKPSPKVSLKTYEPDDGLYVKVISTDGPMVESIDPKYERISGRLSLKGKPFGIDRFTLFSHLHAGQYLYVRYVNDNGLQFGLNQSLVEFYMDEADNAVGCAEDAVFLDQYTYGNRWLTSSGLQVNIMDKPDEDIEHAIDSGTPIRVTISEAKNDKSGHYVMNGKYLYDEYPVDDKITGDDFMAKAHGLFIEHFLEWCTPEEVYGQDEDKGMPLTLVGADIFSHLLYYRSTIAPDTESRYMALMGAGFLALLASSDNDKTYIDHEIAYLNCLIHFATGDNTALRLGHDDCLDGLQRVEQEEATVAILSKYVDPTIDRVKLPTLNRFTSLDLDYLENLVDASNTLNDKIGISEINQIKKTIAGFLEVADVYRNIYHDMTFYGEESDTLEFKMSLVYPSGNHMHPDLVGQTWAIFKQICGFLNTTHGGELLLGVTDYGTSCGLDDDLEYLFNNRLISEKTMDKLRTFLKLKVDKLFTDDQDIAQDSEITATRISYIIEKNDEGHDILRIQIHGYEYGIVAFKPSVSRPAGIAESYLRTSGSTQPVNAEMKRQILEKKLSSSQDESTRKYIRIRKAMKERLIVTLTDYRADDGVSDRLVEPYQILPVHGSIICYDLDRKGIREFKVSRFKDVILSDRRWKNTNRHKELRVDLFDMLEESGKASLHVLIALSNRAYNLMCEEHPASTTHITENHGSDQNELPWVLDTEVYSLTGVGRFCVGLAQDIRIIEGEELKQYVRDYITQSLSRLQSPADA